MAAILRSRGRVALAGLTALAAIALGIAVVGLAAGADRLPAGGAAVPVLGVAIGWGFVGVGLFAWLRRPENILGLLLCGFGLAVLASLLVIADEPLPYLVSRVADPLAVAVFIHLLLAFPSGRLEGRAARAVVAAAYPLMLIPQLAMFLADARLGDPGCDGCPRNLLLLEHQETVAEIARAAQPIATLVLSICTLALVVRRRRDAGAFERRAFAPLLLTGAGVLGLGALSAATQNADLDPDVQQVAQLIFIAAFAGLPAAFLAGLVRSRFFRTATVGRLLERLTAARGASEVGDVLASTLGDPSLAVAYWLPEQNGYVDRAGLPFVMPANGSASTELVHQGRRVGLLVHDAALAEDAELMAATADAAALALENDRLEVELRARVEALRISRARIVEAGDAERRRLGRDLHDGAQQRLVSLLIELQLADERWESEPAAARGLVAQALENARAAVGELRDLAAGIHPAVLSQRGLDAAIESLAARSPVPVELEVDLPERLPFVVETAAYFVVAEAITNVAKYAQATHARVVVRRDGDDAVIAVIDDGAGGADPGGGSGLRGLADRVGALDGTLTVTSPQGEGTEVRARFPLHGGGGRGDT